jgi:hypothetical protein
LPFLQNIYIAIPQTCEILKVWFRVLRWEEDDRVSRLAGNTITSALVREKQKGNCNMMVEAEKTEGRGCMPGAVGS